jgi:hypothetical protein
MPPRVMEPADLPYKSAGSQPVQPVGPFAPLQRVDCSGPQNKVGEIERKSIPLHVKLSFRERL